MATRRSATRAFIAALLVAAVASLCAASLASCESPHGAFVTGTSDDRRQLRELFDLLDTTHSDPVERFAIVRQISSKLLAQREYGRLAAFLTSLAGEVPATVKNAGEAARPNDAGAAKGALGAGPPGDPYAAWYLFTAAYAYELQGSAPIAALYYDRIVKNWPDLIVDGRSIHFECLSRLVEIVNSPERRIEYYQDMIARYSDRVDMGRVLFLLGKEYEKVGDWDLAIKTYAKFLPYFTTTIPGYPDAYQYARNMVDFYNSPKDWTYEDLQVLVAKIKAALAAGDPVKLLRYRAKVNFFAVDWHKDESEVNSQALFDFSPFMAGGRIFAADRLDPASSSRKAYLKTWGWTERISTWYLYFRKIYFPADPEIHGRWEWAGIYFGEKSR
ncbi:MAG: tetratricopeptide repeat protein [Treponema sp.]|nr:tetratricopeptide repeat protein [Treponema sp.]